MPPSTRRSLIPGLAAAALLVLVLPIPVRAHSDLASSDPPEGTTVPSPFSGPVVLTFSEPLADGSKVDLVGPDGSVVSTGIVDGETATMTITLASALAPGAYQARWTSIADDGDLLRGIVKFSVAAAATPTPEPAATAPSATDDNGGAGSDAILPIIIVLIVVAAGAFYLVRRNRPT
jgi:hypothetical protein